MSGRQDVVISTWDRLATALVPFLRRTLCLGCSAFDVPEPHRGITCRPIVRIGRSGRSLFRNEHRSVSVAVARGRLFCLRKKRKSQSQPAASSVERLLASFPLIYNRPTRNASACRRRVRVFYLLLSTESTGITCRATRRKLFFTCRRLHDPAAVTGTSTKGIANPFRPNSSVSIRHINID